MALRTKKFLLHHLERSAIELKHDGQYFQIDHALPGKSVDIQTPEGELKAELVKLPWITDRA